MQIFYFFRTGVYTSTRFAVHACVGSRNVTVEAFGVIRTRKRNLQNQFGIFALISLSRIKSKCESFLINNLFYNEAFERKI